MLEPEFLISAAVRSWNVFALMVNKQTYELAKQQGVVWRYIAKFKLYNMILRHGTVSVHIEKAIGVVNTGSPTDEFLHSVCVLLDKAARGEEAEEEEPNDTLLGTCTRSDVALVLELLRKIGFTKFFIEEYDVDDICSGYPTIIWTVSHDNNRLMSVDVADGVIQFDTLDETTEMELRSLLRPGDEVHDKYMRVLERESSDDEGSDYEDPDYEDPDPDPDPDSE